MSDIILTVDNLSIAATTGATVLDGVSLQVCRGEVLALIGASGSGKTTLALAALGHLRPGLRAAGGTLHLDGVEMLTAPQPILNRMRGATAAYIAQSAASAFNPRIRLGDQVIESALLHRSQAPEQARARAKELFRYISLPTPERIGTRFPYQVSGGQLQRFMIAMGMQEEPLLLVCDEPTSALDVTTQVEVMRLLKQVIADNDTAALFVSHDLAVVAQIATRIAVMRAGRIVEIGETRQIIEAPGEDYTRELIAACQHLSLGALARKPSRSASGAGPALSVAGLNAGYGKVSDGKPQIATLQGVDLAVGKSEIVAVIGESGSGKTTLARVIAGLHAPAAGEGRAERRDPGRSRHAANGIGAPPDPARRADGRYGAQSETPAAPNPGTRAGFLPRAQGCGGRGAHARAAGDGQPARALSRPLSHRNFGRREAARQSRPCARRRARDPDLRRDHLGAGHDRRRADHRTGEAPARRAGPHHHLHQP